MSDEPTESGSIDLTRLEDGYEFQGELRRTDRSATYLARHRAMGRDVTISVVEANTAAEQEVLAAIAADARTLVAMRHPNVVPLIETRWLAPSRLAIVRARVRGTTLAQALAAVGPMPETRAVELLRDVGDVLDWAASGGVVHRYVTSEHVCFQQGSGRVLVSFGLPLAIEGEPARHDGDLANAANACSDTLSLARLGHEMLTGRTTMPGRTSARLSRVSDRVAHAIEEGLRCDAVSPLDMHRFLAMLGTDRDDAFASIATAASAAVVPRGADRPVSEPALPLIEPAPVATPSVPQAGVSGAAAVGSEPASAPHAPAPSNVQPPPAAIMPPSMHRHPEPARRGRGLLLLSMIGLIALIGTTFALIQRERSSRAERPATADSRRAADAGDVDMTPPPPDPSLITPGGDGPAPVVRPRTASPGAADAPRSTDRRTGDVCDSPTTADQRACLLRHIERSDRELNSVYQSLLQTLSAREGETAAALRSEQREWLSRRDSACQQTGGGDGLWADARAGCFREMSTRRAAELRRALEAAAP